MKTMLGYVDVDSPIHRLTGATKLLCFFMGASAAMLTYDTRCLLALAAGGVVAFRLSKVPFRDVSFVLAFILFFLFLNNVAIYLFSPEEGVRVYGSRSELLHVAGGYFVTAEQLFYQANVTLKYATVIPLALLFLTTTHPSEFAASLHRIGVSYRIAYAVAIALRYIPDVQREFRNIALAQQARGLELSGKEKLHRRAKHASAILLPLVLSSLQRIETVSAALELRGFGRRKSRTWYSGRPFAARDAVALAIVAAALVASTAVTFADGSRFYNPFRP